MIAKEPELAALQYLRFGWSVIPMRQRGKRPAISWLTFQTTLADEEEVRGWFRRWPEANLGVVTGAISGLVVLDVDPRHGGDQSLRALEREHGALPKTLEAISGGGGRHVYFAHPGGDVRNRVGIAPGIDLRGDAGCIVVPPSIHPSGRRYRWKAGRGPGQLIMASIPRWLLS
jgi:hypothetical protein